MLKGKLANRSWADLPHEVIRLVADDVISEADYPLAWTISPVETYRSVWDTLVGFKDLNNLQNVCRQWETAINTARFWWTAIATLDPEHKHDIFNRNRNSRDQLPPAVMFRHIYNSSCIPCRLNAFWDTTAGIGNSARQEDAPLLENVIGCCPLHQDTTFCGLCLRDHFPREKILAAGAVHRSEIDLRNRWMGIGLQRNSTGIYQQCTAICKHCRNEQLKNLLLRQGYPELYNSDDIMMRKTTHDFVDVAFGSLTNTLDNLLQYFWLKENTLFTRLITQNLQDERARAAPGMAADVYWTAYRNATADRPIEKFRYLAVRGWAVMRVNSGLWISPRDTWDQGSIQRLAARVAARKRDYSMNPMDQIISDIDAHYVEPNLEVMINCVNPSLADYLEDMYEGVFYEIVLPALKNCFNRLLASADSKCQDRCTAVSQMTADILLGADYLQSPKNWCMDYEWSFHYPRSAQSESSTSSDPHGSPKQSSDTISTDGRPSPTTTLQTTPSPSPELKTFTLDLDITENNEVPVVDMGFHRRKTPNLIEVPEREPPPMLPLEHPARIPRSPDLVGASVKAWIMNIWHEFSKPLFYCECGICLRIPGHANRRTSPGPPNLLARLKGNEYYSPSYGSAYADSDEESDFYNEGEEEEEEDADVLGWESDNFPAVEQVEPRYVEIVERGLPVSTQITLAAAPVQNRFVPTQPVISPTVDSRLVQPSAVVQLKEEPGLIMYLSTPTNVLDLTQSVSAGQRRVHEEAFDDEDLFSDENLRVSIESKRRRSSSLERVAGERRVRDAADIGGPDGEIVHDAEEFGHGRKRVKSFDGVDEDHDSGAEAVLSDAYDDLDPNDDSILQG